MSTIKYKILIVDDHPFTLKVLTKILEKQDFNVFSFTNPIEALEFLDKKENDIDLIVSDMMMEEMSGMDFLSVVKQNHSISQIPFIFLSAAHNDNIKRDAFEKGAIDFFDKPVNTNLFVSKIQTILQNISLTQLAGNILLTGNENTLTPTDVLKYCEMEKLNGFVYFSNAILETVFNFTNGVIEYSSYNDKLSSDFELLLTWKKYTFIVSRSKFNINAVRHYYKQLQLSTTTITSDSHSGKFDNFFSYFPDLIEVFIYKGSWNGVKNSDDYTYNFLLESLHSLESSINVEKNRPLISSKITLQDGLVLFLVKYNKKNIAFLLKSEKEFSRINKMWSASQK